MNLEMCQCLYGTAGVGIKNKLLNNQVVAQVA